MMRCANMALGASTRNSMCPVEPRLTPRKDSFSEKNKKAPVQDPLAPSLVSLSGWTGMCKRPVTQQHTHRYPRLLRPSQRCCPWHKVCDTFEDYNFVWQVFTDRTFVELRSIVSTQYGANKQHRPRRWTERGLLLHEWLVVV